MVDGVNINSLPLKWWRSNIGLVSQEPILFGGTIYENLTFGQQDVDPERVAAACEVANAMVFIKSAPDGLDTKVHGAQHSCCYDFCVWSMCSVQPWSPFGPSHVALCMTHAWLCIISHARNPCHHLRLPATPAHAASMLSSWKQCTGLEHHSEHD